jgi:hypothetical protein
MTWGDQNAYLKKYDAIHAQLGDEYFLYARSSATVKIAAEIFPKTTEWKEVAPTLIDSG